jgi:hypothetical protein
MKNEIPLSAYKCSKKASVGSWSFNIIGTIEEEG